jgi:RNA recognition motif-containing protein
MSSRGHHFQGNDNASGTLRHDGGFNINNGPGPQPSANGWVIFVTGMNPSNDDNAQNDDDDAWLDVFSDYGHVSRFIRPRHRQNGLFPGYAIVEYAEKTQAQDAINALHGKTLWGTTTLGVDWAFVQSTGNRMRSNPRTW